MRIEKTVLDKVTGKIAQATVELDPVDDASIISGIETEWAASDLIRTRDRKKQELQDHAVSLIQVHIPGVYSIDQAKLGMGFVSGIAPASRIPNGPIDKVEAIMAMHDAEKPTIDGMDQTALDAYDPMTGPAWPA